VCFAFDNFYRSASADLVRLFVSSNLPWHSRYDHFRRAAINADTSTGRTLLRAATCLALAAEVSYSEDVDMPKARSLRGAYYAI